MRTQLIVNKAYRLELINDDLIRAEITGQIGYINAVQMVEERKRMSDGKPVKILLSISNMKFIEQDAQRYLASPEAEEGICKGALVHNSSSLVVKTIVNTFLKMRSGKSPAKVFLNEDAAMQWLASEDRRSD